MGIITMTQVYEALADAVQARGVSAVFGLMGEETAWLTVALDARGIAYYATRHEATAVGMADGYSRESGKLGIALVSRGPGLTNALTTIVSAAKARSRVVVIVGEGDIGAVDPAKGVTAKGENKYIDQPGVLTACGVTNAVLTSPESAVADLNAVMDRAEHGLTIALSLPMDILDLEAGDAEARVQLPAVTARTATPEDEQISAVADLVQAGARRPVILAGRGAARAGAEIERLADTIGAVLATTLMGKNLFTGNPYDLGIVGLLGSPVSSELLTGADLVLVFGSSLDIYTTGRGALFGEARVVRFESDPASAPKSVTPDLTVLGDAGAAAQALADELDRRSYHAAGYRTEETRQRLQSFVLAESFEDASRPDALDPRRLMVEFDRLLPSNRTVVVDDGHHWTWPGTYLAVPKPGSFILPIEYFSIGAATGVALGVAVASPDKTTVYCVGDGGMLMTLSDIDTAVRYNLPVVTLVADDCAFGSEVHYLQLTGFSDDLARCASPSFEDIAAAVRSKAATLRTLDDLAKVRELLADPQGPLLVHCKINGDIRADWVDFHFRDTEFSAAAGGAA
jgi:acetolactate synthase-1/2/3 large subunit